MAEYAPSPYRVIIGRKVSEEESVQIEIHGTDREPIQADVDSFLDQLATHRKKHNEAVVEMMDGKVRELDRRIDARGEELRETQAKVESAQRELAKLNDKVARRVRQVG